MDFQLITCIVERGRAEHVADAALGAGAHGVTIYAARGRGVRERLVFVGHLINPEKEVLLTVCRKDQANEIFDTIVNAAKIDEPGKGFAFMAGVERAAGFLTDRNLPRRRPVSVPGQPAGRSRRRSPTARRSKRGRGR